MSLFTEHLSADAEEAVYAMSASCDGASSVLTGLEHSVLDSLCLKGSKGFISLIFGKSQDCFFFSIQLVPFSGQHPMFLD